MGTIALMFIVLASVAYIALPYFRPHAPAGKLSRKRRHKGPDLQEQRDTLLATLKDLELDREMGKISDEDYAEMNTKFRTEAAAIMKRLDQSNGKSPHAAVEAELRELRKNRQAGRQERCTKCGARLAAKDRFCSNCGVQLGTGKR